MKLKLKHVAVFILIMGIFQFTSCEQVGILGQGGVPGSKVKQEINDAATEANMLSYLVLKPYYDYFYGPGAAAGMLVLSIAIDGAVVPSIAGIDESKHYTRPSVDDCTANIRGMGFILGTWVGSATCNLETVPALIQLGPIGI